MTGTTVFPSCVCAPCRSGVVGAASLRWRSANEASPFVVAVASVDSGVASGGDEGEVGE